MNRAEVQSRTLFVLDGEGRILGTRVAVSGVGRCCFDPELGGLYEGNAGLRSEGIGVSSERRAGEGGMRSRRVRWAWGCGADGVWIESDLSPSASSGQTQGRITTNR